MELIELKDHPFFTACQYHPEFLSRPGKPHPLFRGLIEAAQRHGQVSTSDFNTTHPNASVQQPVPSSAA